MILDLIYFISCFISISQGWLHFVHRSMFTVSCSWLNISGRKGEVCVYAHVLELCHLSVLYVQGLGGLHKCDYPAPHDSEYNEILMIHTPIYRCWHHLSFPYCTSSLCVSKHVTCIFHLLTRLIAFHTKVCVCLWIYPCVLKPVCRHVHNRSHSCFHIAESQIIHHVSREEGSSEE